MNDIKKVLIVAICVVLVIAIAAGVSIGVMANTMNGLKDRVEELDQAYASDVAAMKAEIEAAKAANENLVTAADFEAKLAAAIGEQNQTMQSLISTAVKNQIEDLEVEGLTEEQVNEIIDAAVANCLTEADIDAIIADVDTGLTKDEVKKIVANYTAGSLTYAQIVNLIDDADYDLRKFLEDQFTEELNKVIAQVNALGGDLDKLEQSTSSYVVSGKTITIKSTKGLIDWAKDTDNGKSWNGYTVNLEVDVDLAGIEWNPIDTDSFITFNGNGHTISNLSVDDYQYSGFFGCTGALVVKNVVFDNANVKALAGDQTWVGVVAGATQTIVGNNYSAFSDITVKNSTVYGEDKCGGLFGLLNEYDMTMNKITVTNCQIGSDKADAAGGVVGRVGAIFITVNDFTYDNNTLTAKNDNKGEIDGKNSRATIESAADLDATLSGGYVALPDDMTISSNDTTANSGYGSTGVTVTNGATFNGNGNTLTVNNANGTWDCAINPQNGTIKNVTVNGAFRGIFMSKASGDVYIDNVVLDKVCYTFNSDAGSKEYGVYISNSTLNGWTSYSNVHKEVVFTNCNFGQGTGNYQYAFCRPYNASVFENCVFEEGFEFDTSKTSELVFINCYYGDTLITAENAATLAKGDVVFFCNGLNDITIK